MPKSRTESSKPRLSEIARHVVYPSGIVTTAWPKVQAKCAEMGVRFDPWQDGVGTLALGKLKNGKYASTVGGITLSIPRQVGKTFLVGMIIIALCVLFPGYTVLWTAHRTRTASKTFASMQGMVKRKKIWPHVGAIRTTNGEQEIRFKNGSIIMFGAREQGFGRGFDQVDAEVFDEAQILTEKALEDMVAAANQSQHEAGALLFFMGTPPRPSDPGEEFTNRRTKALTGKSKGVYVEFSADPNARLDDHSQWSKANPSFPHRTPVESMERMRENLTDDDSFRREALGIWDERKTVKTAFSPGIWSARKGVKPEGGRKVFGVKFSPDGATVALSGALRPDDPNAPIFVEAIKSLSASQSTAWLVDFLVERKDEAAQIVIDGSSGAAFLVNALRQEKVPARAILTPNVSEVIAAHSMFERGVIEGGLEHSGESDLTTQAEAAIKRKIGNAGGFGWDSPADGTSVALLDAATLAYWGAKTTKRRPGRKGGFL